MDKVSFEMFLVVLLGVLLIVGVFIVWVLFSIIGSCLEAISEDIEKLANGEGDKNE